jgi:Cys-tRNA(Pro)/Cys-tRNA(Cys) deacylase
MSATIETPVFEVLQKQTIPYELIDIPLSDDRKPIRDLEAWLIDKQLDPSAIVRSILFRDENGQFILLAVAGAGHADWALLRKHLGARKLRMAEYNEVEEATGYRVGAVPPIGLPKHLRILVDVSVRNYDEVVIGSGVLGYAIKLKSLALQSLLIDCQFGQFIKQI